MIRIGLTTAAAKPPRIIGIVASAMAATSSVTVSGVQVGDLLAVYGGGGNLAMRLSGMAAAVTSMPAHRSLGRVTPYRKISNHPA